MERPAGEDWKTTLRLKGELLQRLKAENDATGTSYQKIVERALDRYLKPLARYPKRRKA
jgi:predicted DNA binding CopG/RHH family protein